jgi:predicted nucleotidyltransferase
MRSIEALRLPPSVRAALGDFRDGLARRFGDRVRDLRLFGSRARGDARPESDADLLVVLDQVTRADFLAVMDLCGDVLLAHDVIIDPHLVAADRFERSRVQQRPLATAIEREGVPL